jgi:DNA-binding NarL/FixJ family response regulator
VKVALADDHAIFRTAVAQCLESSGVEVPVSAATGDELLAGMREYRVDVAVIDVCLADRGDEGIAAARAVKDEFPEVAILMLSAYTATQQAIMLLDGFGPGIGYLRKDEINIASLEPRLARLVAGEQVLGRSIVNQLLRPTPNDPLTALTRQEHEVLRLMAEGHSNAGIAKELSVTNRTVEDHVRHIFEKLGISAAEAKNKRVLAVVTYLRWRGGGGPKAAG